MKARRGLRENPPARLLLPGRVGVHYYGIVLDKRLPADPGTAYPVCTAGERACPPEDCGGIGGFYDLLDALGDPAHKQYDELRDWVGDDYDPDAFSIKEVNRMLAPLRRRDKTSRGWVPAR